MASISKVLALCVLLACASCSHQEMHEAMTGKSASTDTKVATINAKCPMSGEKVEADGGTMQFDGQSIGFCCKKCVPQFSSLSEKDKLAALAKNGTTLPPK